MPGPPPLQPDPPAAHADIAKAGEVGRVVFPAFRQARLDLPAAASARRPPDTAAILT